MAMVTPEQWEDAWNELQRTLAQFMTITECLSEIEHPTEEDVKSVWMMHHSLKRKNKQIYRRHKSCVDEYKKKQEREESRQQRLDWK